MTLYQSITDVFQEVLQYIEKMSDFHAEWQNCDSFQWFRDICAAMDY